MMKKFNSNDLANVSGGVGVWNSEDGIAMKLSGKKDNTAYANFIRQNHNLNENVNIDGEPIEGYTWGEMADIYDGSSAWDTTYGVLPEHVNNFKAYCLKNGIQFDDRR